MSAILKYHKIGYHVYADDTQLYISFKCKQPLESISKVNSCLSDYAIIKGERLMGHIRPISQL